MQNIKIGKENVLNYLIVRLPILSSVFAGSSKMSSKTLYKIAQSSNQFYIRLKLAGNPKSCENTLKILAKDNESDIRNEVAQNPNISQDIIGVLSKDRCVFVRARVAENKNCTIKLL